MNALTNGGRSSFDAWLLRTYRATAEFDEERNCYNDPSVHMAWQAWRSSGAEIAALRLMLIECRERQRENGDLRLSKEWPPEYREFMDRLDAAIERAEKAEANHD